MILKSFTVSETVVVDARTNRVSIINISEDYQTASFPFVAGNLTALAMFEREDGDEDQHAGRLEIRCGEGLVLSGSINIDFGGIRRTRAVMEIGTFEVQECDHVHFDLIIGDVSVSRWSVAVRLTEQQPLPVQSGDLPPAD